MIIHKQQRKLFKTYLTLSHKFLSSLRYVFSYPPVEFDGHNHQKAHTRQVIPVTSTHCCRHCSGGAVHGVANETKIATPAAAVKYRNGHSVDFLKSPRHKVDGGATRWQWPARCRLRRFGSRLFPALARRSRWQQAKREGTSQIRCVCPSPSFLFSFLLHKCKNSST